MEPIIIMNAWLTSKQTVGFIADSETAKMLSSKKILCRYDEKHDQFRLYCILNKKNKEGKRFIVSLENYMLKTKNVVRHANGNSFDFRFSNLIELKEKSKFLGVRVRNNNRFQANIKYIGNPNGLYLGTYNDEYSAAYAYNIAYEKIHGAGSANELDENMLRLIDKESIRTYVEQKLNS